MDLEQQIKKAFLPYKSEVKRRAVGALKYDYLVPAGPYEEQWDWDAFFIAMSLLSDIPSEAIYLKNWALNYLTYTDSKTGFTPGLITPNGRDKRLNHMKPFLAQGVYVASKTLGDFSWVKPYWKKLELAVTYRERYLWSTQYDLGMWFDSMESGADNNAAALLYPNGTVVAVDLNAFLYREYSAMSMVAREVGMKSAAQKFARKAAKIKQNMNKYLWSKEFGSYYNRNNETGELIVCDTYSNYVALWAGLATPANGKRMIRNVLVNPKKLWARYGLRSLSKDYYKYNNVNMIKPHSNWQGPVWPIANYIGMHALLNYGFQKQAQELAKKIVHLCLRDIERTGGMHENYHADTGEPLAAPNFVSWNLLVAGMMEQARTKTNPFALK
jgi:alpha,alpha-trehalase